MTEAKSQYGDIGVTIGDDHVATVEMQKPPNNHISVDLVDSLIEALQDLDDDDRCRAVVLTVGSSPT